MKLEVTEISHNELHNSHGQVFENDHGKSYFPDRVLGSVVIVIRGKFSRL